MYTEVFAAIGLAWHAFIAVVTTIGTVQIFRHYSRSPARPVSSHLDDQSVPHVTIIRPCTGLEVYLYECLASTFRQDYPAHKLTICFCVSSKLDPAYNVLLRLLEEFPDRDAVIYVEDEDPNLSSQHGSDIGPNPKIRNMSQSYRKAKGDIVWILDCNIWVGQGTCGRMVDKLCGFTPERTTQRRPYKLVAHLPICVSVDDLSLSSTANKKANAAGGLLEQSFLSTAHAKMYVAINSVAVAPCINGKSTMFRRSHLDYLTRGRGIDFFGQNICEDHLIGDILWKSHIPPRLAFSETCAKGRDQRGEQDTTQSNPGALKYKNHGLALNDLAIQPISNMSVSSYIARRVRWLRVRKFTVLVATLVEPGTESFLCSAIGAWGTTASKYTRHIFGQSWTACLTWWLVSVSIWCLVDNMVFRTLQGGGSIEIPTLSAGNTRLAQPIGTSALDAQSSLPPFARLTSYDRTGHDKSPLRKLDLSTWLAAWLSRESLALPIWTWAVYGGTTVTWRDKQFWVGTDMKVHELVEK